MEIIDEQLSGGVDVLHRVMSSDADKIRRTQEEIDPKDFDTVIDSIIGAHRIYILGLRSSGVLAGFLSFYFNHIFEDVVNVGAAQGETFEQMLRIGPNDVLIAISFPRYSQRTLKAVHYAKSRAPASSALPIPPARRWPPWPTMCCWPAARWLPSLIRWWRP